jgi:hypothetical protein
MISNLGFTVKGHIKISDPESGEVYIDKDNAIHYENISEAIANSLSNRGTGQIYRMAFGNGASTIDSTGVITYLPPNVTGTNAGLYNKTYEKIIDDTLLANSDPTRNKMSISHTSGKTYSDILIQCVLDYGEPSGQYAFDNASDMNSQYVFDELCLLSSYGTETRLISHVVFHPVQKALNRQIQVDYTIRIQSITNLVTV